jgi:hypothetical protein
MAVTEILVIDGKDPAQGYMSFSEILHRLESVALERSWGPLEIFAPLDALSMAAEGAPLSHLLSRVVTINRIQALKWRAVSRDINLIPVKGRPMIAARVDGILVALADYPNRDQSLPVPV